MFFLALSGQDTDIVHQSCIDLALFHILRVFPIHICQELTTPRNREFNVECEKMPLKTPISAFKVLLHLFTVLCF